MRTSYKIILAAAAFIILVAGTTFSEETHSKEIEKWKDNVKSFVDEYNSLTEQKKWNMDRIESIIAKLDGILNELERKKSALEVEEAQIESDKRLGVISERKAYETKLENLHNTTECRILFIQTADYEAQMMLKTAKHCAKTGKKGKAKELYRRVITTFIGSDYKSYVEQAKFGLEDLK